MEDSSKTQVYYLEVSVFVQKEVIWLDISAQSVEHGGSSKHSEAAHPQSEAPWFVRGSEIEGHTVAELMNEKNRTFKGCK
ncbi:hypothetical protein EON65_47030 [archaeon]|nr:MAG: hypothetical protein EON65_47030 [archaeon]